MKSEPFDLKPEPPREPALEECCGTGCNPCVFDVYAEAVARYRAKLADWEQQRQRG